MPILKGAAREKARARIVEIRDVSCSLARAGDGWTRCLAGGMAGTALFLHYLPDDLRTPETEGEALGLLVEAMRGTWSSFLGWSLFEGEAGICWALAHCARSWESGEIEEVLDDVDRRILALLEAAHPPVVFDLISGVAGLGVYALERLPRPGAKRCLEAAVDLLDASAIADGDGLCWRAPQAAESVDLGMAHGAAGVIAFLALAHAAGIRRQRTARLVRGALDWLFAAAPRTGAELRFPFQVPPDRDKGTRNAWCYGDAGIAAATLVAGRSLRSRAWQQAAVELARSAAGCRGEAAGVVDAGLCHGAAGLAHIFNRLHQRTDDRLCLDAARHWLSLLADMRTGEGLAGYAAWSLSDWRPERGLLEGIAGIGLALIASISDREPAWDRPFLLS